MTRPFSIHSSPFIIHYSPSPFGQYRIEPPSPTDQTLQTSITDRFVANVFSATTFTGHKHNDDIGLIYMNARYYIPSIGRFASADTIVPDPANTQDFNRYTYVRNNPVRHTDPSGHYIPEGDGETGSYECQGLEGVGGCVAGGYDANGTPVNQCLDVYDCVYPDGFENAGTYIIPPEHKIGIGITFRGHIDTPVVSITGNVGWEWVYDPIDQEVTEFATGGAGIDFHPLDIITWVKKSMSGGKPPKPVSLGGNVSPYASIIYNVNDVVGVAGDYSGSFLSQTTTLAWKLGITWGEAWVPNDPDQNKPYSKVYGPAFGYDLSVSSDYTYYLPIKTYDTSNLLLPTYHTDKWLEFLTGD